jgi:hypothetical protein
MKAFLRHAQPDDQLQDWDLDVQDGGAGLVKKLTGVDVSFVSYIQRWAKLHWNFSNRIFVSHKYAVLRIHDILLITFWSYIYIIFKY